MADFLIVVLFVSMLLCPCVVALRSSKAEPDQDEGAEADKPAKAVPAQRS